VEFDIHEKSGRRELSTPLSDPLHEPVTGTQIFVQHDMTASLQYDLQISPRYRPPPPFVIDPPDFNDGYDRLGFAFACFSPTLPILMSGTVERHNGMRGGDRQG
jgi:hypothetical protein